jgi:predicted RNA-binding Zn-ribbon protein involved in translation (DUF1610 family)
VPAAAPISTLPVTLPLTGAAGSASPASSSVAATWQGGPLPTAPSSASLAAKPSTAVAEATWPCPRCGEQVAISLDSCQSCGAGFLSGASTAMSARLPVVGDMAKMSQGQRLLVAAGISAALIVVLVVVAFVIGHVV